MCGIVFPFDFQHAFRKNSFQRTREKQRFIPVRCNTYHQPCSHSRTAARLGCRNISINYHHKDPSSSTSTGNSWNGVLIFNIGTRTIEKMWILSFVVNRSRNALLRGERNVPCQDGDNQVHGCIVLARRDSFFEKSWPLNKSHEVLLTNQVKQNTSKRAHIFCLLF